MDVREKMVELIESARYWGSNTSEEIADHLIRNGVTVREYGYWVSLTDCANAGVYCSACNKKVYKEYYVLRNRKNKLRYDYCPHCGAKMMPHPPKGDRKSVV